jgi:hypothetical protein
MPLPQCFCWTRFGVEAGQSIGRILGRKEEERTANQGTFFWGIGNAVGPSMLELTRLSRKPEALFSPIRSVPRKEDAKPSSVVYWTAAETLTGERYALPQRSMITSRMSGATRHYALVCHRESPIEIEIACEKLVFARLRNVLTGRPVGASQVTAVVRHLSCEDRLGSLSYDVAFRARLVPPYFIVLRSPVELPSADKVSTWETVVREAWANRVGVKASHAKDDTQRKLHF